MKRLLRPIVAVAAATLATAGFAVVTAAPASAAVRGGIDVRPTSGNEETLFGGSTTTDCPDGTVTSAFFIDDADDPSGSDLPRETGYLGDGVKNGEGPQQFSGASIANLKTNNSGSFSKSGPYQIRFLCASTAGTTDSYETTMNYVAGTGGALGTYAIVAPPVVAPPVTPPSPPVTPPSPPVTPPAARVTATTLTATPAGPVQQGTTVELTADVTPTTGADDPTGSVEFFNGSISLGVDNTLTGTGVGTLAVSSLPVGVNSITAVFTPAAGAQLTGSKSAPAIVKVTPVVAPPPVIPEAPFVVLLPLAAVGIAFAALRRRRLAA